MPKSGWRHIPVIPVLKGLRDKVVRPCLRKGGRDGEMEEGRKEGRERERRKEDGKRGAG